MLCGKGCLDAKKPAHEGVYLIPVRELQSCTFFDTESDIATRPRTFLLILQRERKIFDPSVRRTDQQINQALSLCSSWR